MSPATTLASHPPLRQRCGVEILQAATDRRARQPRDLMDGLQAAPSRRPYLSGCEHPLTALIELRAESIPAFANRLRVDHAKLRTAGSPHQESHHPESHHRMAPRHKAIHLLWRMSLPEHPAQILEAAWVHRVAFKIEEKIVSIRQRQLIETKPWLVRQYFESAQSR